MKAAIATALGYALSIGGPTSAVYGAMSAALTVGASRGEDIASSANRVRGTLAGMTVGVAIALIGSFAALPPILAASLGIGLTAYLCLAFGWGVAGVRVGAAICVVMVLAHGGDALDYSAIRVSNTLIGIVSGLIVSHFVLTVTGRDAVTRASAESLSSAADLLEALSIADKPLPLTLHIAMLDRAADLEKAMRDAAREFHTTSATGDPGIDFVKQVGALCAGTLTAAIAHSDLCASPDALAQAQSLRVSAARLAARARGSASSGVSVGPGTKLFTAAPDGDLDAVALQGLALGLRKIDAALGAMHR